MTEEQRLKNLCVPTGAIDVVLDTDTFNEIDDQFAIAYLLRAGADIRTAAIYAAPFFNANSTSPADGMEKSYDEIHKVLALLGASVPVFRGSTQFLPDEKTPVVSAAAEDLAARAMRYSPKHPLYIVAIGAITNIASALLLAPQIAENCVVVWLGGNARHYADNREFNLMQDIAAARVVMQSGVPFVQLPCLGVVDAFTLSKPEIEYWLLGKNPLADYLGKNTIVAAEKYARGAWTRVIWDVTAVAWLCNAGDRFMASRLLPTALPTYDHRYAAADGATMRYVYSIHRDALMTDLIEKICRQKNK